MGPRDAIKSHIQEAVRHDCQINGNLYPVTRKEYTTSVSDPNIITFDHAENMEYYSKGWLRGNDTSNVFDQDILAIYRNCGELPKCS
jgi:hypothetical protein